MTKTASSKVDICMSCYLAVEWKFNDTTRVWVPYEPGTKKPHRCVMGE